MSEVRTKTHWRVSKPRLAEVLADLELLEDDTASAIRSWIDRNTDALSPGFAEPLRHWLLVLLDGDARSKPRSQATVYRYLGSVRPFLEHWATKYDHVREVTKTDIYAVIEPLRSYQRNNAVCALRSLFRFARKRGLTFANPTTGVKSRPADPGMVPMTDTEISAVEQLAVSPTERLVLALAAEHAARTSTIRHLTLDDVDLPNRRITIAGHNQRLGELSRRALLVWLEYRRTIWPHTPNRYLLVNAKTVLNKGPVSAPHLSFRLSGSGFSIDRIRADRILHEALTAGPDPLHLSLVFNVSHDTALRYSTVAQQLLSDELEQPTEQ